MFWLFWCVWINLLSCFFFRSHGNKHGEKDIRKYCRKNSLEDIFELLPLELRSSKFFTWSTYVHLLLYIWKNKQVSLISEGKLFISGQQLNNYRTTSWYKNFMGLFMLVFPLNFQIKSLLYSQYYAEACNKQEVTTVRNYGTVRLDLGKKYGTQLRTEFLEKVLYCKKYSKSIYSTFSVLHLRYYIFRTVPYTFRTPVMLALHFCFRLLHFSFLPITLPRHCVRRAPPATLHNQITILWTS